MTFRVSKLIQFNLSTTATLGTEESSHCREVETRVNEWIVHQKNCHCREVAVVEKWPLVDARLYSEVSYTQNMDGQGKEPVLHDT